MNNLKTDLSKLKNEEMILNMGPQHPSMHGVIYPL
jgi:NADH:ubiquinone oxidoreductase subunit D